MHFQLEITPDFTHQVKFALQHSSAATDFASGACTKLDAPARPPRATRELCSRAQGHVTWRVVYEQVRVDANDWLAWCPRRTLVLEVSPSSLVRFAS